MATSLEYIREKAAMYGVDSVSTPELLALVIGRQGKYSPIAVSETLLAQFRSIAGLCAARQDELEEWMGKGSAERLRIMLELIKRTKAEPNVELPQIQSPYDAFQLCADMGHLEQEQIVVLLLDTKNRVKGKRLVYQGSVHTTVIRISEIFREAVRANATSIVVIHNHPSGDPTPSPEDAALTRELVKAGTLMDIEVLDHLVIGGNRFVSMKERGLGF